MTELIPAPGTYLAEEIEDKEEVLLDHAKTQLAKGKVVAVGEPEHVDRGVFIQAPVKVGDIVYFLSYAGDYDWTKINGKKYYTVLRKDHRFILKE